MFLMVFSTLLATLIVYLWTLTKPFYWKNKGIPYVFPFPFLGVYGFQSIPNYFRKLYNLYPNEGILGFHFFVKPALLIKDPEIIKNILIRDFEHFAKNAFYGNRKFDAFGATMLLLEGEEWRDMRTKVSVHFTPLKLRTILYGNVVNTMDYSREFINKLIAKHEPIQVDKLTECIATDIIIRTVFDIESDCFNEKSFFHGIGWKFFNIRANSKFYIGMVEPKLIDYFQITIQDKEIIRFLKQIFKDVVEHRKNNPNNKQDFLQGMIDLMKMDDAHTKRKCIDDENKCGEYDFMKLFSQVLILLAGGIESSATVMSYFLYEVSLNQVIQEKCRAEIMSVVAETGTDIRPEDLSKLKYLDMAVKEAVRMYPPFTLIPRYCTKSYQLNDRDLIIEPGTLVFIPLKGIQYDAKYYAQPEVFLPERFTDVRPADDGTYLSWNIGPRICLGKNFARMEMMCVLSRLLRYYRFTLSPRTQVPLKLNENTLVTKSENGIWLNVETLT